MLGLRGLCGFVSAFDGLTVSAAAGERYRAARKIGLLPGESRLVESARGHAACSVRAGTPDINSEQRWQLFARLPKARSTGSQVCLVDLVTLATLVSKLVISAGPFRFRLLLLTLSYILVLSVKGIQ